MELLEVHRSTHGEEPVYSYTYDDEDGHGHGDVDEKQLAVGVPDGGGVAECGLVQQVVQEGDAEGQGKEVTQSQQ